MKITHFTYPTAFELIRQDGQVDLEGCNAKRGWDSMSRNDRRLIYKAIGRHVWLTQGEKAKTASSNEIALTFNSEDIGAIKWSEYKKQFRNSKHKWSIVEAFEESARMMGDNTNDYWLVSKPIPLCKMLETA
jgi:hypothetical protein